MAQIKRRRTQGGEWRYTAVIRIKRHGVIVHQEARTFPRQALARDWAQRREIELAGPGALERTRMGDTSIRRLIERYIEEFEGIGGWGHEKGAALRRLAAGELGELSAVTLTSDRLVRHVRERLAAGTGPVTAGNDLMWLGVVLRAARGAWAVPVALEAWLMARETCRQLRLIRSSRPRTRTPTREEMLQLDGYFERSDQRARMPMRHILWFAIYSGRREAEICRLTWADTDLGRLTSIVRDAKHPKGSEGNDRPFRLSARAAAIIALQPQTTPLIFPYQPSSIRASFGRACRLLGITDLRFHDLRHEAATRLFEAGLSIPEVAAHTLHESWANLKRYTHLARREEVLEAPFL